MSDHRPAHFVSLGFICLSCKTNVNVSYHRGVKCFVFTAMLSPSLEALVGLLMLWLIYHPSTATCTPFAYGRDSACSSNLAASTHPVSSSMNLNFERDFCEIKSIDDLRSLQSVARIFGRNMVNAHKIFVNSCHHLPSDTSWLKICMSAKTKFGNMDRQMSHQW